MFTILKSKLRPPTVRHAVGDRTPLLLRLDTAVGRPAPAGNVVMVSAAPGYGKSSLLAAWAAHLGAQGTPVVWYNLSPGDCALPVFLAYLEAGLRGALPGFAPAPTENIPGAGRPRDAETDWAAPDLTDDDRSAIESLVSSLVAPLEELPGGHLPGHGAAGRPRLLIVLDDLHHVAGHAAIDAALAFLIRQLPAGLVLALGSRRDPGAGLPLARLRCSGRVTVLGEPEIRLLPSEIGRAFPVLPRAAGRSAIARLVEKLEGWPLGLHILHELLADEPLAAQHADPSGAQLVRRVTDELDAYFDEETLASLGRPLYSFLLRTAVLDEIAIPAADAVTEGSGSEVMIAQALYRHFFLQRIGVEPAVYRYHPLFAAFLCRRLREMYGAEEQRRLQRLAAAYYAREGHWAVAAAQFLAAGDVGAALAALNTQREEAGEPAAVAAAPRVRAIQPRSVPLEVPAAVLRDRGDAAARRRLVELLGLQAHPQDIPILESFFEDEDPTVRATAQATVSGLDRRASGVLRITMFGKFQLWRGTVPVAEREWRRKRAKLLLAYLLLTGPEGATRQAIAQKVWPDAMAGDAADQFYAHLRALRAVLEPDLEKGGNSIHITNQQGRYAFAFGCPHHWDLAEFLRYRDLGRRAERLGQVPVAAAAYESAVALYLGDLLPEPPFNDVAWLYSLRNGCRDDLLSMRTFLAEHAAGCGDWETALAHWKAILAVEPAREVVHARMMTVYAWLGRRDDALAQFHSCRATIQRLLGAEPLPSTVELYQQILANTAPTAEGVLVAGEP